ncbi:MAG: peptidylprolyl isomerase [Endomicrobia bacterium]|nr:peptidylprolyl isomerase [Endomicrobiia bacterium]
MKKVLVVAVLAVFALGACNGKGKAKDNSPVIAKVGGTQVTEKMIDDKLAATSPAYREYVNTPVGKKQFIDAVVRENIILEAAKQSGMANKKEYSEALKDFKAEQERQYAEYKDGMLIEMYVKNVHDGITASDADIQKYYNDNKDTFEHPVAYTVRHILVTSKEEAEAAYARLQNGEKFEKVAQEISQDKQSAQNGGLIGPFRKGVLPPEFEKAVISLKTGQMSGIVETTYGYHIIFKVSEQTLPAVSFEQAKPEIAGIIERERFDKWYEDTKKKLGVTVNYDAMTPAPQKQAAAPEKSAPAV